MAGELVPLVLIPRYTTYHGATTFTTIGMDVTDYSSAMVNVWRGPLSGGGTVAFSFEESTDGDSWQTCVGGTGGDPGQDSETQFTPTINRRWFRIKVILTGTDPSVTAWALGHLVMREA